MQGKQQGGSAFGGLEGCWFLEGRIFFTAKSGGDAKKGQVWEYTIAAEKLSLVYESSGIADLNMPDSIVASPRGGLVICEDGEGKDPMRLQCLTRDGQLCVFGINNIDRTKRRTTDSARGIWKANGPERPSVPTANGSS